MHPLLRIGARPDRARALAGTLALCALLGPLVAQDHGRTPDAWLPRGVGGGGAQFAPSLSPHDAAVVFVASDMAHLERSADFGSSWSTVPATALVPSTRSAVAFTQDPQRLYALDAAGDRSVPVTSRDGGRTWQALPQDPSGGEAFGLFVDPASTQRLLVAGYRRVWQSEDGGASFRLAFDARPGFVHVGGAFWDGQDVYLGTSEGLLTSKDGGRSFAPAGISGIPSGEGIVSLHGARLGGTLRLFAVTLASADLYPGVTGAEHAGYRGVYVWEPAQVQWRRSVTGIDGHAFFAAGDERDPTLCWLAGSRFDGREQAPAVWRSVDGGQSWSSVFATRDNANIATGWQGSGGDRGWSYGEYALGFAVSAADPRRAILTDLGGFHLTQDAGRSWTAGYVAPPSRHAAGAPTPKGRSYLSNGAENTSVWHLCWHDARTSIASASDVRLMRSEDGGERWSLDFTGHAQNTMCHVVRTATGTLYGGSSTAHDLYQSTYLQDTRIDQAGGQLLRSADGGRSWTVLHDFGDPVVWLALHPQDPERLYASVVEHAQGRGGIWMTSELSKGAGATWQRLATPPRTQGHPFVIRVLADGRLLASYCARRDGSGAFTPSSGVFVSSDSGQSWEDRSDPRMRYWTKDVVVDPYDPAQDTWYAGVWSGWGGPPNDLGGLYRTRDAGRSWQRLLVLHRVSSITISPVVPDEAYVTTETDGLWFTAELTTAAPRFARVPSYPFRQPERVFYAPHDPNEIWVTSFGKGLFVARAAMEDLGLGKAGANGTARLSAGARFEAGAPLHFDLTSAAPGRIALLLLSGSRGDLAVFGGTLVPWPLQLTLPVLTDARGRARWPLALPQQLAKSFELHAQAWILDPSASQGLSASNALRGRTR